MNPPAQTCLPTACEPLHVGRPNLPERAVFDALVDGIFTRRWLTNRGPLVEEFEAQVASFLGVRHCVAVANATLGLQLAARALGLTGEVLVPAFTFVASAHALRWEGLDPVFCEIEPATHLLDVAALEARITPRTSAILGVHTWGQACYPEQLAELARRHRLELFFDAAHAFGCGHGGGMLGGFGRCEVFSFHATKFFNTCEGGAITTNDDALAAQLRLMLNFGFSGVDQVSCLGTNAKLSELHAAMGLANLQGIGTLVATNRNHFQHYQQKLAQLPGLRVLEYPANQPANYQYVVIEVDAAAAGFDRDELLDALRARGVLARRYFFPGCHRMEPYAQNPGTPLPLTDELCRRVLVLPTGSALDAADVARVCAAIDEFAAARRRRPLEQAIPADEAHGWT